ncbi:hypothetical protein I656_03727 [Geobacillus sp. WSUCF1]|nr:hypothetical protein I656_03727 [Geobacillus sp. WSUCF1]
MVVCASGTILAKNKERETINGTNSVGGRFDVFPPHSRLLAACGLGLFARAAARAH